MLFFLTVKYVHVNIGAYRLLQRYSAALFCLVFPVFTHQQASISDLLSHNIGQSFGYNNVLFFFPYI